MSKYVSGKEIASTLAQDFAHRVVSAERAPRLGIISAAESEVTASYVARKRAFAQEIGVEVLEQHIADNDNTQQVIDLVEELSAQTDGLLVQLPLGDTLNTEAILASIPPVKDVDCLNPLTRKEGHIQSPVARAVLEILNRFVPAWQEKKIVMLGYGWLVGQPTAILLRSQGAQVEIIEKDTRALQRQEQLAQAEIIISGAGVPGLITPDMIRDGVVLIDAGTATSQGSIQGDIHPDCYAKASLISPTPGGVGPIAVAKLFENLLAITDTEK